MIWTESVHGHCFSAHNLHPRVTVLSGLPPDLFLNQKIV